MIRHFPALLAVLLAPAFGACALLFSGPTASVRFHSRPDSAAVMVDGDPVVYRTPVDIEIPRSSEPRRVTIMSSESARTIELDASPSTAFWLGNAPLPVVGHLIDLASERMYTYDDEIFIDLVDSANSYPRWRSGDFRSGDLRGGVSFPLPISLFLAAYSLDTGAAPLRSLGPFMNVSFSLDYFLSGDRFVRLDVRAMTNDCLGDCPPRIRQFSTALLYGLDANRFALALGARYTVNDVVFLDFDGPDGHGPDRRIPSLGGTLSAGFRVAGGTWLVADVSTTAGLRSDRATEISHDATLRLFFAFGRTTPW